MDGPAYVYVQRMHVDRKNRNIGPVDMVGIARSVVEDDMEARVAMSRTGVTFSPVRAVPYLSA